MTRLYSLSNYFPTFLILVFVLLMSSFDLTAQTSTISIHARGNIGAEDMTLTVNGLTLGSWNDIPVGNYSTFTVTVNNQLTINSIRVNSTSGEGWEHALVVDKIVIDGIDYLSDASTTKGYTWDSVASCSVNYKMIKWLSCADGWFEYEAAQGVVLAQTNSDNCTSEVPVIIFDTDMGPDIDDALALAMLHAYESNGDAQIAAVTLSRNSNLGARYCDAINTFYNRPNIPVGKYFGSTPKDSADYAYTGSIVQSGNYPHDIHTSGSIKEAYKVMRDVLATAPDNSVVIVQTGFSVNTAQLLQSPPDDISPLSGYQLVQQKVSFISFTGARINSSLPEFNIQNDIPSAQYLFANSPVDIIQSDFGLGYHIIYPLSSIYNDFNSSHPIRVSYLTTDLSWHVNNDPYYDMRTWDLTSVIAGIEPLNDYFKPGPRGKIVIQNDGISIFTSDPTGNVIGLGLSGEYTAAEIQKIENRMIELTPQAPGIGRTNALLDYDCPAPINDDCINAMPLVVGTDSCSFQSYTTAHATTSLPATTCGPSSFVDLWYSFYSDNTTLTLDYNQSPGTSRYYMLYDACPLAGGSEVFCASVSDGAGSLNLTIPDTSVEYYLAIKYGAVDNDTDQSLCLHTSSILNPCPINIVVSDAGPHFPNQSYQAKEIIETSGSTIINTPNVLYQAGHYVELNAEFECLVAFEIEIVGCTPE